MRFRSAMGHGLNAFAKLFGGSESCPVESGDDGWPMLRYWVPARQMCCNTRASLAEDLLRCFTIPCMLYILVSSLRRVSIKFQVELANLFNQRRCTLRFRTNLTFERPGAVSPIFNCRFELISPLGIQQRWFAATVCPGWKQTASAARLSAGHAEDLVAAGVPAVGFVGFLSFSLPILCNQAPWAKHAVLFVADFAGTQAPTNSLTSVRQENVHYQPPKVRRFDEQ